MSGRKSTEVANVLSQGELVRKLADKDFSYRINDYCQSIEKARQTADTCCKAMKTGLTLSQEAQEVFGAQAKEQLESGQSLVRGVISFDDLGIKATKAKQALDKIEKCLAEGDKEAADIRDAIRNKYDYCTPEYNRAQVVVGIYQECRKEQQRLIKEMSALATQANLAASDAKARVNQWEKISRQLQEYDRLAKEKLKADEQKQKLTDALTAVPADLAQKFMPEEYSAIVKTIEHLQAGSDRDVVEGFQNAYGKIGVFQNLLTAKYEEWKRQKADAETLLSGVESLANATYIGPIAYYNEGEKAERTGMFDYLEEYAGKKEYRRDFTSRLAAAKQDIGKERFSDAVQKLRDQQENLISVQQEALELQEAMLKKTALAGAIQDVMDELHYDTNLEILDDNPAHGFRLTCQVGDEIIDFDHIDINTNGQVIVDLNHTESRTGACHESWKSITRAMREAGLPLTDVKKNGVSIISKGSGIRTDTEHGQRSR